MPKQFRQDSSFPSFASVSKDSRIFRVTSGRISGCTCQQQSSLNKERKNNESANPLQKNENSSEHIPKPWCDLDVSNNRSRTKPLRLSSSPPIARNPRVHAGWDAEYLRLRLNYSSRAGL